MAKATEKQKEQFKIWYQNNKSKKAAQQKLWQTNNREKVSLNNKLFHKNNPEYKSNYMLKYNFGITLEQKREMLKEQNYKCAISSKEINEKCATDHCHKNGHIRGLLESNINRGLGLFYDNVILLQHAIDYLNNTEHKNKIKQIIENNKHKYYELDKSWNDKDKNKNRGLRFHYNISLWDYNDILKLQNEKCALSNQLHHENDVLCVDHYEENNNKTIRGLIFTQYNYGLGMLNHNIEWINNSINYLKENNCETVA